MVETEEIKKRFKKCIDTTIIFCTNAEQVKFLGKLYGNTFENFDHVSSDIEVYFAKDNNYGWQDGYNFNYLKTHGWGNWKTITFNELINYKKIYELW